MSGSVVLVSAQLMTIAEAGARGTQVGNFGNSLWWAAGTITTLGSNLALVTIPGRVIAFLLDVYAVSAFTYLPERSPLSLLDLTWP